MKFLMHRLSSLAPEQKANSTAIAIALGAVLFLQLESSPRPAGADTFRPVATKKTTIVTPVKQVEVTAADETLTPERKMERAIERKVKLLEQGIVFLQKTPDYTAQFSKQELVDGEMLDEQTMIMKVQHAPFSVYMKWVDFDIGREVIYVDGSNDGKLLVHPGGWKARLPPLSLEPDSSIALKESRHPITEVGLMNLARKIVEFHKADLLAKNIVRCEQAADQSVNGRDCHCYVTEYKDAASSKDYRKTITFIDKEWSLPLFIKNFGWPDEGMAETGEALDTVTLIEQYSYSDIKFRASLTAMDFDRTNEDYGFKRQ